jgi:hypothetical protein
VASQLRAQEVVRRVGSGDGDLGTLRQDELSLGKDPCIDDRLVLALVELFAVGDLADVHGVAQDV